MSIDADSAAAAPSAPSHAEGRIEEIVSLLDQGYVPNYLYYDGELFELEQERLFSRTWVFLAHESEIPEPGDFVTRWIANDSILVLRGDDGVIRAFVNSCRHRGSRLCSAEIGRARNFTCIYHGWTYDRRGRLTGVPFGRAIYQDLDKSSLGLLPVAQVDTVEGFVFGCLSPETESLREYLGDFTFYLEMQTRRSKAGLEVLGVPQRWIVDADWKIGSENLLGDAYHTPYSHGSAYEIGLMPWGGEESKPGGAKAGVHVQAGNGDVALARRPPGFYYGYPDEMIDVLRSQLTQEQIKVFDEGTGDGSGSWIVRWHAFPNLSSINIPMMFDGASDPMYFIRLWRPMGPGVTECMSWVLVEADAPEEFKKRVRRAYIASFGASGMLEQDDMENWRTISKSAKGETSRHVRQFVKMGEGQGIEPLTFWPGPGTAWPTQFFDVPAKTFLKRWARWLSD
jgi:phenylpropionate dioxygenase-like ring-hydroxylating dioxygenase large terminal subunit